jgi:hypothetical protein
MIVGLVVLYTLVVGIIIVVLHGVVFAMHTTVVAVIVVHGVVAHVVGVGVLVCCNRVSLAFYYRSNSGINCFC